MVLVVCHVRHFTRCAAPRRMTRGCGEHSTDSFHPSLIARNNRTGAIADLCRKSIPLRFTQNFPEPGLIPVTTPIPPNAAHKPNLTRTVYQIWLRKVRGERERFGEGGRPLRKGSPFLSKVFPLLLPQLLQSGGDAGELFAIGGELRTLGVHNSGGRLGNKGLVGKLLFGAQDLGFRLFLLRR